MRVLTTAVVAGLLLAGSAFGEDAETAIKPKKIQGTWERRIEKENLKVVVVKIITPTHLAVFHQTDSNGHHTLQGHGGTYELKGNIFTEKYEFSSNENLIGKDSVSQLKLVGDELHQTWIDNGRPRATEVWTRVKSPKRD
ncbi:MAG: hypothetical protein KDA88_13965 [Planctomycetaceae bacterium]|nr:hypothetical protein [Planctomycetaceae bacterium]MCA9030918.1 hypothetical protein [Planctomycetaceae bacterium]